MKRVLVIDQSGEPHTIVPPKRAIALVIGNKPKAIVRESYDDDSMRSEKIDMQTPAVIQLVHFARAKKQKNRSVRFSRINILVRDKYRCGYCGKKFPRSKLNIDHIVPKSQGGKTTWINVICSCIKCNSRKANRTPEEAGMRLLIQPYVPSSLPLAKMQFDGYSLPEQWINYCYWEGEIDED